MMEDGMDDDLIKRLNRWGADEGLQNYFIGSRSARRDCAEAATALTEAEAEIVRLRGALDDIYRHVDWWSTRRISSHIRAALSRPRRQRHE